MKATDTIMYEGATLVVLMEILPDDETKGCIKYFLNGVEVETWDRLNFRYKRIFTALADSLCETYGLTKWSY
jgi:hypothetical protein